MSTYSFGSGFLFGTRTDIANQTPQLFGTLQDVSVEFSSTSKQLFGQVQYAVLVARGQSKIQCKAKMGSLSANLFNSLFFGGTFASGQTAITISEAAAVPATPGPYTVTVANAGAAGGNFIQDEGVFYAATGLPLKLVSAAPAQGQYSVAAGTYTFAAADQGAGLLMNYTYAVAASGQKITLANPQVGTNPVFSAQLFTQANTSAGRKTAVLNLHACVASKLSLATKIEDFTVPELDFEAFADAGGNVFDWSFNEVS